MTDPCRRLVERGPWTEDLLLRRCTPPIGPWNTWSNAAYAIAGAVVYGLDRTDRGAVMLLCLLALAAGSWAYHSAKTVRANRFDRVGMLMVFGALEVLAIDPHDPRIAGAMWIGALLVAVVFTYRLPKADLDVLMGLFLAVAMLAAWLKGSVALGALSMGLFLLGYGLWKIDRRVAEAMLAGTKPILPPRIVQYHHGAWHHLTAAAIAAMHLAVIA